MKILMLLSSSSVTGPAELCLDDAMALRAAGHELLFGCDTRRPGNYVEEIRAHGFTLCDELTLCPKPTAAELARDVLRLARRLDGVDLVHTRFSHDHSVALMARGFGDTPVVRTAEIAKALRPGFMRARSLRSADALIVSCEAYAKVARERHGVAADRVFVLPGRVDASRFSPGAGVEVRRELGVQDDEVLFGIVSRIKEDRHHEVLVRGFARMAAAHPEAKLAIVGRGEHEPSLRALVAELKLEGRVLFAGYRKGDALVAAYRAFDAKVWLAEGNDGTCRAVLEAMACGKPVIAGSEGAMAELVRDGVDGRVVPLSPERVEAALVELCDGAVRERMSRSALERARSFTPERRSAALTAIYERVLSR